MDVNSANMSALYTGLSTAFNTGFSAVAPSYGTVAMTIKSTTAANEYPKFDDFPGIREWIGDRVVNQLSGSKYTIKNKSFENTIGVAITDIEDNNLGLYPKMSEQMGQTAAAFPDQLVWPLFAAGDKNRCSDGQYFFDADHKGYSKGGKAASQSNVAKGDKPAWYLIDDTQVVKPMVYQERKPFKFVAKDKETDDNVFFKGKFVYGVDGRCNAGFGFWQLAYKSALELNEDNFEAARVAMQSRFKRDGSAIIIRPTKLIVPPALERTAKKLLKAELINGGESNIMQGMAEIVVIPHLAE